MALCALTYFPKSSRPTVGAPHNPPTPPLLHSTTSCVHSLWLHSLVFQTYSTSTWSLPKHRRDWAQSRQQWWRWWIHRKESRWHNASHPCWGSFESYNSGSGICFFFFFFGAVETRGSGFLRSPLTEVVVLNEPMVGRRLLHTTMSRFWDLFVTSCYMAGIKKV